MQQHVASDAPLCAHLPRPFLCLCKALLQEGHLLPEGAGFPPILLCPLLCILNPAPRNFKYDLGTSSALATILYNLVMPCSQMEINEIDFTSKLPVSDGHLVGVALQIHLVPQRTHAHDPTFSYLGCRRLSDSWYTCCGLQVASCIMQKPAIAGPSFCYD